MFSSQADYDVAAAWGPAWRGSEVIRRNFPPAHAWQIKELVVGVEGRGSFSILPLIRSRIMARMMDYTERLC